jgi:plastocyanin
MIMRALLAGFLLMGCFASDSPAAVARPTTTSVTIATAPGETLAFVPAEVTVVGGGPIAVSFRNQSSLAHNLVFPGAPPAATRTIVDPGDGDELVLDPGAPGRYPYVCTIHDGMAGVLIVQLPAP